MSLLPKVPRVSEDELLDAIDTLRKYLGEDAHGRCVLPLVRELGFQLEPVLRYRGVGIPDRARILAATCPD